MTLVATIKRGMDDHPVSTTPASQPMFSGFFGVPGIYSLNGRTYDLRQEGYAIIAEMGQTTRRAIIFKEDVFAAVSGLAWACVDGNANTGQSVSALNSAARSDILSLMCNETCDWAIADLTSLGVECRIVRSVTDGPLNNRYDGHVTIEVKIDGQWRWADLSNKLIFPGSVADTAPADITTAEALAPIAFDNTRSVDAYDTAGFFQVEMATDEQRLGFAANVLQIPGFDDGGFTEFMIPASLYSSDDERNALVTHVEGIASNYRVLSTDAWMAKFYA